MRILVYFFPTSEYTANGMTCAKLMANFEAEYTFCDLVSFSHYLL